MSYILHVRVTCSLPAMACAPVLLNSWDEASLETEITALLGITCLSAFYGRGLPTYCSQEPSQNSGETILEEADFPDSVG